MKEEIISLIIGIIIFGGTGFYLWYFLYWREKQLGKAWRELLNQCREYEKNWSSRGLYGEKIICKKCGKNAEENLYHSIVSTGRCFRCKKCKIEASFDETTQFHNPEKWQFYLDNFKLKINN